MIVGLYIARSLGVLLGAAGLTCGGYVLLFERPTANLELWYSGITALVMASALLVTPWNKIKHPGVFYGLMSLLILCLLPIGALIFGIFVVVKIHGGVAWSDSFVLPVLAVVFLFQVPVIYFSRRIKLRRQASNKALH
ncbi:MAG TPA: hypothetical protein VFF41_00950 [Gallionella sp.]|nr:hypothetical protein [Gallionella sp.]